MVERASYTAALYEALFVDVHTQAVYEALYVDVDEESLVERATYTACVCTSRCRASASHHPPASYYRVAKTHRMPYLYRSFSAKEPYI